MDPATQCFDAVPGQRLLSLPPGVLGVLFKEAGKVLHGMATCKTLNNRLPNDVIGLKLQPREASQLPRGEDAGFTCGNVVSAMRRFRSTPGLEWSLLDRSIVFSRKTVEEKFPNAGWASVVHPGGFVTGRVGQITSFQIDCHMRNELETERAASRVSLGMTSALGLGVLSTLASLTIGVACSVVDILEAVGACSQTLKSIEMYGDCALHPHEILDVGRALQKCASLSSFSLNSTDPKGWDYAYDAPNNAHGAAVAHCTSQLIKCCPLLINVKLVLCNIGDVGAAELAVALGESGKIIDLDISCNRISENGFRPLFDVISRFRFFAGFWSETDAGTRLLIDALPRATNLQQLGINFYDETSLYIREKVCSKCQELGIHVTIDN